MHSFSKLGSAAAFGLFLLGAAPAHAQVTVNINPPSWGPPVPTTAQYYYIPETQGYYDLRAQRYVVLRNGQWVRVASLNGYNPTQFHPVVIDYVGAQPWVYVEKHRKQYPGVVVVPVRNLPPGQVKRLENGKGLPPGQAKKLYRGDYDGKAKGKGKSHGKGKR